MRTTYSILSLLMFVGVGNLQAKNLAHPDELYEGPEYEKARHSDQ